MIKPTFSIIHPTARYDKWTASAIEWMRQTSNEQVEYILAIDDPHIELDGVNALNVKVVRTDLSQGLPGCVRAYNDGAKASTGRIILLNSDDMFPTKDLADGKWQERILDKVGDRLCDEWVLGVDAGNPEVFTFQILSRKRYEKLGHVLYPGYHSLYGDTEFTYRAYHDNVVIEAKDIKIEHRHPCFGYQWDEVYTKENNPQWLEHGRQLFESRKNNKWN